MHNHSAWILIIFIFIILCAGCTSPESPPPESVPGPSIIEIEDIASAGSVFTITDAIGREVEIPKNISHILCAGPGCLRYLSYLQKPEYAVTNNPEERYVGRSAWLPYLTGYPELRNLPSMQTPIYPAQIQSLSPRPDLIILMNVSGPYTPDELSRMTNIPILVLKEGNILDMREDFNYSLRVLGLLTGSSERASEVIQFFDKIIENLDSRVSTIPEFQHTYAYIGAFTNSNPQGILTSTYEYYPFELLNVKNALKTDSTDGKGSEPVLITPAIINRIQADAIFIDLSTLDNKENAIRELENIAEFANTAAVKNGMVYGLYPTSIYGESHEIDLINAYCIGKAMYPDKFIDVDPKTMAEYILTFLYGRSIFEDMNKEVGNFALNRIPVFT